ncbi:MAG: glycoside hydrolase family 2 TIM barrel-domain containing protein [Pirellulales bacterium]
MRAYVLVVAAILVGASTAFADSPVVRVENRAGLWQLSRDGQPYFIRGAGGGGSWELLAKLGGNSVRTWGHDRLGEELDQAHKLGLTVTAGIWLGQVRQGFDWSDADSLIKQREVIRQAVLKYKDHPALLMWALGNEMEDPEGKNGAVWSEINNLAQLVKALDARHPTMTVIAEIGGAKVRNLHSLCPDIDIVGINSYAGGPSVGERYRKLGGTKPYVLTEFGPPGIWEIKPNEIGAFRELTSTAKADAYRATYRQAVVDQPGRCLGSYAFLWGQKQEVTATWFSLLLRDGSRLEAVDTLVESWTGKPVVNRCPKIEAFEASGPTSVKPNTVVKLSVKTSDPERDSLQVAWELVGDEEQYGSGGDAEAAGSTFANSILKADSTSAEVKLPGEGGLYRVFVTVRDGHGGAAIANLPIRVEGPSRVAVGSSAKLPLVVFGESSDTQPYVPSGWMGDAKSIKLDPTHADKPFAGKTSLRCEFAATTGWGAVAWQHPAQDWGDQRGGFDLSGAKRLVFYARGETGEEEVSFSFGMIGPEKKYFDTAKRSLGKVKLTRDWKRYEIRLDDLPTQENLTRIKTGFVWSVASSGQPIIFYLDDVRWE